MTQTITITRPDDWHLHVRDGDAMRCVVPHTARQMGRAIIMPNLKPRSPRRRWCGLPRPHSVGRA
jgi:dihydroorotase